MSVGIETVIGVDPDTDAHAVAIYSKGKLTRLDRWGLMDFYLNFQGGGSDGVILCIENVMANQFVYKRNEQKTKAAQSKVAMHIGRCQQSQVELMRVLDHLDVPYQLISPMRGNWAEKKEQFEKVTGWTGTSSKDTRSAAFFGYLILNSMKGEK